jgi:hypothetical protein
VTVQADVIEELRERLRATQDAAERMARNVPPQGWAAHGDDQQPNADEIESLLAALRSLRELLPEELQEQLRETIRNVLLLVRGILDLALDRLETGELTAPRQPNEPAEDIPIL